METLVELIKDQTAEFKTKYLVKVAEFAERDFERFSSMTEIQIKKEKGLLDSKWKTFENGEWVTKPTYFHSKTSHNFWKKVRLIKEKGREAFVAGKVKSAEMNYDSATRKAAARIVAKGLAPEKVKVLECAIDQAGNMEARLSDNVKYVRLFTILAWGPIIAPHYRYLVK